MKKILWLPAWYPNKNEPFAGDFIQRHAKAASLCNAVQVIHVLRDRDGKITNKVKREYRQDGNLKEEIIYYYTPVIPLSFLDKIVSNKSYRYLYRKAIRDYIQAEGLPACSHVHVVNKNGLAALWLKRKYNIPFVVTEHWTAYLAGAIPGFSNSSRLFKIMWNKIMRASHGLSVVSHYLGEAIKRIKNDTRFTVIPNVVDDTVFFPLKTVKNGIRQFIHVSTLGYQKNPEMILQAFGLVKKENPAFALTIVGGRQKHLDELVTHLSLEQHVYFHEEIPQQQLAVFMQQSHALILYSRYETFGCVLIEANACGIPAIVSDLPVFHEIIAEGKNGYFVAGENPAALAQKILWFMDRPLQMPDENIARMAKEKYNYRAVGKLFDEFYKAAFVIKP